MRKDLKTALVAMLIAFLSSSCNSQDIHPYKQKFADFQNWESVRPGDFTFENFQPYRAVYSRTYTQASSGKTVNDQVVMIAQKVFWYGKNAILFELQDVGTPEFDNTNGRTQFYYLDEKTLQLYLAVGPKAGTPEDYTSVRILDKKIVTSRLNTATGEVEFKELKTKDPSFGFYQLRFLMWAAMDLKVGEKIKHEPVFNPPAGLTTVSLGTVEEQVDYTTPDGKKYRPFLIDNTNDASSPVVHKFFVINEAPYLLAQGIYNADDDEIYRWWYKLESWELLDGK